MKSAAQITLCDLMIIETRDFDPLATKMGSGSTASWSLCTSISECLYGQNLVGFTKKKETRLLSGKAGSTARFFFQRPSKADSYFETAFKNKTTHEVTENEIKNHGFLYKNFRNLLLVN